MSSKPLKKGRPSKALKLDGSIAKSLSEPVKVKNAEDGHSSRTSGQTVVDSFTTAKDDLKSVSTSALLQMKEKLFSEIEEIQKKVNLSIKNKDLEIQNLINKHSELANNNNELLEKNKVLENDNKALVRKIQSMSTHKEVSELQEEKHKLNLKLQEKEEKLSKLVDLVTPLRKKVKEQEGLREQLNQASGEIKSLHIVNEEFKKELSDSKKKQEAIEKKEKELDKSKLKAESFFEKSKKGICEEQSKLQKERQYVKDQKNKLDHEKMKIQEEQIRLSHESKTSEELKLQLNEEKELLNEEKKAIEDDKIMLDNEWGDIMIKKKELEEMVKLPDSHREVIKENEEQLEKMENKNRLLHEQIATKESDLKDLILKHNILKDKLNVMKEGYNSEVADLRAKYLEANISKESLDQELKSKTMTVVSLQEELSSSKQNLEKRIEAYKMNQGKISKMIMKQKEEEIDDLKQQISELVSTRKRRQESENDDIDSNNKKIKTLVRSEPPSVVQELPNITEEKESDQDNDARSCNTVDDVTNEGDADVNASSALRQIDAFESFLKSSRSKTQESVKQLISDAELVNDSGSVLDQSVQKTNKISEKMENLIQQTELVSSGPDHQVKSVRDIFKDSDSEGEESDSSSQPTTSKEGTHSDLAKCSSEIHPSQIMLATSEPPPPPFTPEPVHLPPPTVSNSPAQTSNRSIQEKPLISVRDINTMSSSLGQDVIIPNLSDSTIAAVEMSDDYAKEKEIETKNMEREIERNLKFQVAGVVKNCLNKFYKTSVFAIQTREDFEVLAVEFSNHFREDIMAAYRLAHSSLAGLVMTSVDRTSIIDQIIFYFQVKKTVNDHLSKYFPPNSPHFISYLANFTNQYSSEIKETYRMMFNSLVGITLTLDNELWIKTKIDFSFNSINSSTCR